MGLYKTSYYYKDRNGNWKVSKTKIDKAPHDVGRWKQSDFIEKNSTSKDKTYLVIKPTKSGLNQKVVKATTYFEEGDEKVVRELITTSNKLPRNKKW